MKLHKPLHLVLAFLFLISCNKEINVNEEMEGRPPDTKLHSEYADKSMIDGYKFTLGDVSDALDSDLTIDKAKKIFGDAPYVKEDGDVVRLKYAVNSNRLYENGMRISMLTLEFKNQKFIRSSIDFTAYSD